MKVELENGYVIDDSFDRLDFNILRQWLSATYWTPGISQEEIVKGAKHSAIVVGCYHGGSQVGFLRVISDKTRFGYFCDVFVDESHRKRGIARAMMRYVMDHPDFADVYQWLLATKDAHGVYAPLGFAPLAEPEMWMMARRPRKS